MAGRHHYLITEPQQNDNFVNYLTLLLEQPKTRTAVIPSPLLTQYGGRVSSLKKDDILFQVGDKPLNYFELISGSIKVVTYSEDGDEFIQGIFNPGESFGEPPLMSGFDYPSSAIALAPSEVWKLPKENFFKLLKENFEIHLEFDKVLCERLRYKNMILSEISFYDPEHRIVSLINYLKEKLGNGQEKFIVPLTRQQLADMSGLRVETVIRTVKTMQEQGKLEIVEHKILV
jgi:CRP-like cAMP-binding protein